MQSGGVSPFPSTLSNGNGNGTANGHAPARKVKICVYCGSAKGKDPAHLEAARALGRVMAKNNISLGKYGAHRFPPLSIWLTSVKYTAAAPSA